MFHLLQRDFVPSETWNLLEVLQAFVSQVEPRAKEVRCDVLTSPQTAAWVSQCHEGGTSETSFVLRGSCQRRSWMTS